MRGCFLVFLYLSLFLSLLCHYVEAGCSCDVGACTCSGDDIADLTGLLSESVCPSGSSYSRLVITEAPNLVNIPDGFAILHASPCSGLQELEVLELHQTGIQNLSSTLFQGLPHLKTLDISNNSYLTSYRDGVFEQLGGSLEELIAMDNRVRSLTRRAFAGLRNLKRLILSRNKIGYFEEGVFSSTGNLIELSLDGNILTDLEGGTFIGLNSLQSLDLRGNPLQLLYPGLFSSFAKTLTHLWMSHDDFVTFGGFDTIPTGLFTGMSKLVELSMVELKITNLTTESFEGLTNLRRLSLRGNRLTLIPKGCFTPLINLEELDLSANGVVCIPDSSDEYYPNLRSLNLSLNGLTHLTKRSFSMLSSSKPTAEFPRLIVNISSNPIRRIEPDTFCDFKGPLELILAAEYQKPPSWANMANWPDNPFALVGNESIIVGLKPSEVIKGRPDAAAFCGPEGSLFQDKILASDMYKNSKYTEKDIENSLNSECPWLVPDELSPWQLAKLGVPGGSHSSLEEGSRIYLLIIVAVCITFLLGALTIIMCYRAWSRRATQKMTMDVEANIGNGNGVGSHSMEPLATIGEVSEKTDLLEKPKNGKPHPPVEANPIPEDQEGSPKEHISRTGRRNSEPRGEELETMTAFGVI
nr:leucine rich repeat containing protein 15 [Hymenolepis microstoma]